MTVYHLYGLFVGHRDMVWLYANKLSILSMSFIDSLKSSSLSTLHQQPQTRKLRQPWSRNADE